jgi:hypothetical protein
MIMQRIAQKYYKSHRFPLGILIKVVKRTVNVFLSIFGSYLQE